MGKLRSQSIDFLTCLNLAATVPELFYTPTIEAAVEIIEHGLSKLAEQKDKIWHNGRKVSSLDAQLSDGDIKINVMNCKNFLFV
jgi:hypothetical protein